MLQLVTVRGSRLLHVAFSSRIAMEDLHRFSVTRINHQSNPMKRAASDRFSLHNDRAVYKVEHHRISS